MRDYAQFFVLLGFLAIVAVFWKGREMKNAITRAISASGVVEVTPVDIAAADGVDVEVETLARCGQSEESSEAGRIAVMWAAKNHCDKLGQTITGTLTHSKDASHGSYAKQNQGARYCDTFDSPSAHTLDLASQILAGLIDDPTGGATQWDAPKAQNALLAAGTPGYTMDADAVAAQRESEGRELVMLDNVPNTRFWR